MWDLAVREEDYKAVDGMIARFAEAPLSFRIVPAYARHDTAAMARIHEQLKNLDARQSQISGRYMATYLENFTAAEDLARLDLQARRNAAIRLTAQTFLAWLEVARGRWTSAKDAFAEAEQMEGGSAVQIDRAIAAMLPFLEVPRADLEGVRRDIEAWQPNAEPPTGNSNLASALRPQLRLYLLGLLSSRLGDDESALRYARELEALSPPAGGRRVVQALAGTVRADVALRAGNGAEALAQLQPANGEVPLELVTVRPFVNVREYSQEHSRWLRANALVMLGRNDEARRWFETSFQGSPLEFVYRAPVYARLARMEDIRGDRKHAIDHYTRFIKLWRASDPPLQTQIKAAESALRRLRSR
jgi:tetratricopeptide (TPR) repeat protein